MLIAIAVALIIYAIFFSSLFKINSIQVSQESCASKNQIEDATSLIGKSLVLTNTDKVTREFRDKFSCLENVEVQKIYPNTLNIQTRSTQAVARIDGTDYFVTESGLVIEKNGNTQLPKIYISQGTGVKLNEKLTGDDILFGLTLAKEVAKTDLAANPNDQKNNGQNWAENCIDAGEGER